MPHRLRGRWDAAARGGAVSRRRDRSVVPRWPALLVGLLLTVVACAGPGEAQSTSEVTLSDPRGDLVVLRGGPAAAEARAGGNVDVVNAVATRTARALRVAVSYADLRMEAGGQWLIDVRFASSGDRLTHELLWERGTYPDSRRRYDSLDMRGSTSEDASSVKCPGLRREVDEAARTITLVVPDVCLGKPQRVRLLALTTERIGHGGRWHYMDVGYEQNSSRRHSPLVVQAP